MSLRTTIVTEPLDAYLQSNFSVKDEALSRVLKTAEAKGMPSIHISGHQAKFMQFLLQSIGAKNVLEIGSLAGYSALSMASVLPPDGKLTAVELNPDYADLIRKNAEQANLSDKINVICDNGRNYVKSAKFEEKLDFVFVDADKPGYYYYLESLTPHIRKGGIFAADNAFAFGYLLDAAPERNPEEIRSVKSFNDAFLSNENYFVTLVPIGDGLILGYKL